MGSLILTEGQRVRFKRNVERYPFFMVLKGALGTVVYVDEFNTGVRLDELHQGAEPWDNVVSWVDPPDNDIEVL